jgi:hypothetical protein
MLKKIAVFLVRRSWADNKVVIGELAPNTQRYKLPCFLGVKQVRGTISSHVLADLHSELPLSVSPSGEKANQ